MLVEIPPWQEIVEMLIREGSFDLVVIGNHGHGALWRMLFGSSSEQIVKNAPCPVMIVRRN